MNARPSRLAAATIFCLSLALVEGAHGGKPSAGPGGGPSTPIGLAATLVFPRYVGLSWNANPEPGIAGYYVYRNTAPKGGYLKLNPSPVAGPSFVDETVAVGTTYYYRVSAITAAGVEGKQCAAVSIAAAEVPDAVPPANPSGFAGQGGYGSVALAWTNPPDGDFAGTTVRYDLSGYPSGPQAGSPVCDRPAAPGSADSFVHAGLTSGRTYYYAAFSYDGAGNFSGGATAFAVPVDNVAPVISGVRADNVTSGSALVTWTTDEPATSQVEYGTTPAYGSVTPLQPALALFHYGNPGGLAPATVYHYRAISVDASGNSAASGDAKFVTAPPPGPSCADCHGALPQSVDYASGGHGKPGIGLPCEACHSSGSGHDLSYKELRPVNGFAYPALSSGLRATADGRKNYCLFACHAPPRGDDHPTGYDEIFRYNTWTYVEILSPEGYVQKYGVNPGTTLPPTSALKLLDVDGNGVNSYGDIVMCTTCHEAHGTPTGYFMIPIAPGPDNSIRQLCIQCHNN